MVDKNYMKKVENKFATDPLSLLGGSPLNGMDVTFEGLSWENVYQKIEKICKNSDLVQIPCKYAETVGKHFKSIVDDVGDWLDSPSISIEGILIEKPNAADITVKICEKLKDGLEKKGSDKSPSTCINVEPDVEAVESLALVASDLDQDVSHNIESDVRMEEIVPIEANSCLIVVDENSEKALSSDAPFGGLLTSAPLAGEVLKPTCHLSNSIQGGLVHAGCSSPIEDSPTHDLVSPIVCYENEYEHQFEQEKSEDSRPVTGVGESSDGFYKEDDLNQTTDGLDLNTELTRDFQDIDLHDSWDDDEDYDLSTVSYYKSKQKSYKKKLSAVLVSKLRLLKDYKKADTSDSEIEVRKPDIQGSGLLTDTKLCSVHNSLDSDWELL